ncbi:MAG: DoxX family protein [Planctomycetes bacterium]|jgi:putative oxidoreductase|nr:DoxX family protein [Planctomycetota bacterium]MCL4728879.1 DoxX family protein [Planctomycetota bacterium]
MEAKRQDLTNSLGLLVLRLGAGAYMMTHGWGKVGMVFRGEFMEKFDPIGLGPHLSLIGAATGEFLCALLVLVGAGTRFAAGVVVFTMLIAAFVIHGSDPWTMGGGASKQPALMFAIMFATLIFTGAGKFSVDGLIWPVWRARRAARK